MQTPRMQTPCEIHDTWDTTVYGQQAGGTHPTRMHSCSLFFQYEDKRVQEYTEPDYQKIILLKEEDRKFTEEWTALKKSKFVLKNWK